MKSILQTSFWVNICGRMAIWTASSEFGTYRLCEQRRFRRACASAQSRQNLRYSIIQAVSQEEPSDRKPDPWPLWMAGHAQLKFVMTECSKTQNRLTGLILLSDHLDAFIQILSKYLRTHCYMDRVKRIWYLSPMRAAKVQASLHIRAVSPEPPLLDHTSSESRGTFRQKARSLAPLNGRACAVKICHDGMLEDTKSLDGAHIAFRSSRCLHSNFE